MDPSCVLSALLFFIGNGLLIPYWALEFYQRHTDYEAFKKLNDEYLEDMWHFRRQWKGFEISAGLINALAWFVFSIPIMQLAWILSLGGRRGLWMHSTMAALALGSCLSEFISKLFYVGVSNVTEWLTTSMNLDSWGSTNDKIGWKALEVSHLVTSGMILWVDAFEWLCLFGILTLIYMSTRSLMCSQDIQVNFTFGRCWAHLGLFIGLLSLLDFIGNVLRFVSWRNFMIISLFLSVLNRLVLLPIWLCLFGSNLSAAAQSVELSKMYEHPSTSNGATLGGVPATALSPSQASFPPSIGSRQEL